MMAWLLALFPGDLEGRLIDRVTFSHVGTVDQAEVDALWDMDAGEAYRQTTVEESLQRLYRLNRFQDIQVEAEREDNTVRLHVHLIRRPLIGHIRWQGATLFDRDRLRRISGVDAGAPVEPATLEAARQRLRGFFHDQGYPEAEVRYKLLPEADGDRQQLTWLLQENRPTTLQRLVFWGPRVYPDWRLIWISRLFPGTRLTHRQLREARHRLERYYLERGYLKVRIDPPAYPRVAGPVTLVWRIDADRPVQVRFLGNRAIAAFELKDAIHLFEGRLITPAVLAQHSQTLTRYYQNRGYPEARVSAHVADQDVVFRIQEGPRVVIDRLVVTGAPPFLESAVLEAAAPLRGPYDPARSSRVQEAVTGLLQRQGYRDASMETGWNPAHPGVLRLDLHPGPRYLVGRVDLAGWPLEMFPALRAQADVPFDPQLPAADALFLMSQLREAGYAESTVRPHVSLDRQAHLADIRYDVTPGPLQRIAHVLLRGLIFTRPLVVQRHLAFRPGDPVRPSELSRTQRALFDTGLFRQVNVQAVPQEDPCVADVVVEVTEGQQMRIGMGIGYASVEGPSANLGYVEENLGGWNRRLNLTASLSWEQQSLRATLGEPYLGGPATNGEVGLFVLNQTVLEPVWRTGAMAAVHHVLSPALIGSLRGFGEYRHARDRQGIVLRGIASALFDSRDSWVNPTLGSYAALDLMVTTDMKGQERLFKPTFRAATFSPLDADTVWMAGARMGYVASLGTPLANDQLFQIGGPIGIRGFALSEALTGRALLMGTAEIRRTLWPSWIGAVFLDLGTVFTRTPDLRLSIGAGLRYVTPLGVVRLDGALKLSPHPGESPGALHLTIGDLF